MQDPGRSSSVGLGGNIAKSLTELSYLGPSERPEPSFQATTEDAGNGSLMRFAPAGGGKTGIRPLVSFLFFFLAEQGEETRKKDPLQHGAWLGDGGGAWGGFGRREGVAQIPPELWVHSLFKYSCSSVLL